MAGQYVQIIVPGYTSLFTRDLAYAVTTPAESSDLNPFDPSSSRPLVEGEWLERADADKVKRGGNNVVSVSGTPDGEGTTPAFLYFNEKGRYDVQMTRRAHIIQGPVGFEFRTKLCCSAGLSVGDAVSVWDWDGVDGEFGCVRRVLAKAVAGFIVGRVTRIFATNDIAVYFNPEGVV